MWAQKLKSSCKLISVGFGLFSSYLSYQYQQTVGDKVDMTKNINQIQQWFNGKSKMAAILTEFYLVQYCKKLSASTLFHQLDITSLIIALANSQNVLVQDICVKMLSVIQFPPDTDMAYYIEQCKPNTLIGLARSNFMNTKWFPNEHRSVLNDNESESKVKMKLQVLLEKIEAQLPNLKPEEMCSRWLYKQVKNEQLPSDPVLNVMVDLCTERDNLELTHQNEIPFKKHIKTYLDVLRRYSTHVQVVNNVNICKEIIEIMKQVIYLYMNDTKIEAQCGNILANLALNKDSGDYKISDFLPLFMKWKQGDDITLKLIADRCLYNLDNQITGNHLSEGIYLLYPNVRKCQKPDIDVVFIHGINGSPFHTWREKDNPDKHILTPCWPKDWLPSDYPNIRVLAVQYESSLSEWSLACPAEKQKYSLNNQAHQIKMKLKNCGVGEKPIIWIAHSMGGLIVKKILLADNANEVASSTKGALFYSVPHLGSPIATQTEKVKFILFPSVEANELSENSRPLQKEHQKFLQLVSKYKIDCVDFGESKPSSLPYIRMKSMIVPRMSNDVGYGKYILLDSNHQDICKPESRSDIRYTELVEMIKRVGYDDNIIQKSRE